MFLDPVAFLLFLTVTASVIFLSPQRARPYLLLAASYLFYAVWDAPMLLLLLAVTVVSWWCGRAIGRHPRRRRALFAVALTAILGALFFFKYFGFVCRGISAAAALFGGQFDFVPDILLPVGISFYTFQALSYVIDIYRGRTAPEGNFFLYALYIGFFPQLIAGPIERSADLLPQLKTVSDFSPDNAVAGCRRMLIGIFEKVAVADVLGLAVDRVYGDLSAANGLAVGIATVLFAFQILCDFKGYSDIARGAARVFGIELSKNFDAPYLSPSIGDFWRRWHITLSGWLRDYLYIPLGGSRVSAARWCVNILTVFLVSGLWHGAALTFVVWGLLHGIYLLIDRALSKVWPTDRLRPFRVALTFAAVCLAWVFFRAETVGEAVAALRLLFADWSGGLPAAWETLGLSPAAAVLGGVSLLFYCFRRPLLSTRGRRAVYAVLLWLAVGSYLYLRCIDVTSGFIYFRF